MNAMQLQLFWELRQTQAEIMNSLKNRHKKDWMTTFMEEELADISAAIKKLESGKFGQCESSGEPIPEDLLKIMPTIKSTKDTESIETFYRKSFNSDFF